MENIRIEYRLKFTDNKQEIIQLDFDANNFELVSNYPSNPPDWTNLDFHQCPHCPLSVNTHPGCPLTLHLVNLVNLFDSISSYDKIYVEVITEERCVSQNTTAQRCVSSLMGLIIASSGCPHTAFLRPMARFHLPFASEEETIYRVTSMYLLAQYFRHKNGIKSDFELCGLEQIYDNLQVTNKAIAERLKIASRNDASINAIIILDMFAKAIPSVIDESLEEIRYLFIPYLTNHGNQKNAGDSEREQ